MHRIVAAASLLALLADPGGVSAAGKPNILIILCDDMGFSDLGCYGGEIRTPNLDALAAGGLRFTQFYNTARCCPTRASLLSGLYPHQAGVGHMMEDQGPEFPGYRDALFWEHEGNRAVRVGDWKLVAKGPAAPWELYDLSTDRVEAKDLASRQPGRVKQLREKWESWARRSRVLPWIWNPPYGSNTSSRANFEPVRVGARGPD
jgi:arylsulfatase A-like enzyme